jgi:hypothetical protein
VNGDLAAGEIEPSGYPGLSSRGPSHNSVLMLSSESFLVIVWLAGGELGTGPMAGGDGWPPPKSSWNMGMVERSDAPGCGYTGIVKRLGCLCERCCREEGGRGGRDVVPARDSH